MTDNFFYDQVTLFRTKNRTKRISQVKRNLIHLYKNILKHGKSSQDLAMLHGKIISRLCTNLKVFCMGVKKQDFGKISKKD